jgi:hypothetical protein
VPMSHEKLANGPLTGYELAQRIEHVLARYMRERLPDQEPTDEVWREQVVGTLHWRILNDWVFGVTILWPLVEYLCEFKCWFTAPGVTPAAGFWRLRLLITTQNIHLKTHEVILSNIPVPLPQVEAGVVAFAFTEKIENPNLVRVHTGIPIEVTEVVRPGPGQTIGSLVKHEVKYDVRDYEPLPEPVVEDTSAAVRVEWGMAVSSPPDEPAAQDSKNLQKFTGIDAEPSPLVMFAIEQFHEHKEEAGVATQPPPAESQADLGLAGVEEVKDHPAVASVLTPAVKAAIDLVNKKRKERGRPGQYRPVEDPDDLAAVSAEEPDPAA